MGLRQNLRTGHYCWMCAPAGQITLQAATGLLTSKALSQQGGSLSLMKINYIVLMATVVYLKIGSGAMGLNEREG